MVASPLFVILSGMTPGDVYGTNLRRVRGDETEAARSRPVLTIGHIFIALVTMRRLGITHQPWSFVSAVIFRGAPITALRQRVSLVHSALVS